VVDGIVALAMAVYWAAAVLLQVYGLNCYVMIALFRRRREARRAEEAAVLRAFHSTVDEADLPIVTTQLPIFNERNVVERLIRAACALDYPRGKHEIQVLDDSTDETGAIAARVVAELQALGHDIRHLRRANRQGYKAGALEAGLACARGELVAIFDADFVPEPDFFRRTIPYLVMEPGCGFVQARWGHRNRDFSILTRVQAIGIDGHFVIEQSARSWNGLLFNFNGTAGVWRRAAIEAAGGWRAATLTEDLDLSYRAQLAGWSGRYLLDVVAAAEIPSDVNAFKSQQYRWAKGSIQVARTLLPDVWRNPDLAWFSKVQASVHLTHYIVHPLMLIMTILVLPLLVWTEFSFRSAWVTVPFALMFVAVLGPTLMYLQAQCHANRQWRRAAWLLPFLMSVGIGLAVNNTRAVLEGLLSKSGEFVRTPKLGEAAECRVTRRSREAWVPYRLPSKPFFVAEIMVGLWAAVSFVEFLLIGRLAVTPLVLINAVGFTYVGVLSLVHDVRSARHLTAR
jgi:cellulose synthase/poly-beta-1,6-N-acetylglucosamine synthase-like glycosyltransferase